MWDGSEPESSGVGSNRFVKCATTAAQENKKISLVYSFSALLNDLLVFP